MKAILKILNQQLIGTIAIQHPNIFQNIFITTLSFKLK